MPEVAQSKVPQSRLRQYRIPRLLRDSPRRNLPRRIARKRTESNFVLSFSRALTHLFSGKNFHLVRELQINGYGIADLVCVVHYEESLNRSKLYAFEIKMRDWRQALKQAFRYKYFSNVSIVVLPPRQTEMARRFLPTFKTLGIGVWSYNKEDREITRIYSPRSHRPFNSTAKSKASRLVRNSQTSAIRRKRAIPSCKGSR